MKKLFILGLAALLTLAAGCSEKDTDTDGTPPIEGISQTGKSCIFPFGCRTIPWCTTTGS